MVKIQFMSLRKFSGGTLSQPDLILAQKTCQHVLSLAHKSRMFYFIKRKFCHWIDLSAKLQCTYFSLAS